jgi:peptide/nickel transport system substrate-binding protein
VSRRLGLSLSMLAVGSALFVAAGLAGPAGGEVTRTGARTAAEVRKGGTLRLARFSDVDFVDPALAYQSWSWPIVYATCAKLFNYPDEPGAAGTRLVPEVVDRYTVSKDGRTYTFTLKQTYRFHTGARVTAQSFADAFNRDAQPKLASPAAAFMGEIVGAQAVIDGKAQSISGVRVLDRYRLQIRLTKPLGDFISRLALPFFCPIRPNTPIDSKGIDNPAGSGPYYVAERIVNQRIVLRRNPFYRGNRPANVDQVVWTAGVSREECLRAVEEDTIDYCNPFGIPTTAYRSLAEKYGINRPGGQFFVRPGLSTWFLAFNHTRPAFAGPGQIPLKKAINYAIDRPEMARAFGYLAGRRTDQMLPPALARAERIYPIRGADPTTARKWLAQARFRPKELVFYTSTVSTAVEIAQVLVFNLKQLGIDVDVKYFEGIVLSGKAATRGEPFDIVLLGWQADYPDAAGFFVPLLSQGAVASGAHVDDPRLDRRIEAANRLTGAARREAWADLDVHLMRDNPPWAPIVHTQGRMFVSRSTGCVVGHPVYGFNIAAACKK